MENQSDVTKTETIDEKQQRELDQLDAFFEDLPSGSSIQIFRVKPSWCSGVLEEILLSDLDEPINYDWIIGKWGGQEIKLRIRGSDGRFRRVFNLILRSYPPKVKGQTITQASLSEGALAGGISNPMEQYLALLGAVQSTIKEFAAPPKGNDTLALITQIGAIATPVLTALVQRLSAPPPSPPSMMEMIKTMGEIREFVRPQFEGSSQNTDDNSLAASIVEIGKSLIESKNESPPPPRQLPNYMTPPRLVAVSQPASEQEESAAPASAPQSPQPETQQDLSDQELGQLIQSIDPKILNNIPDILAKLPPEAARSLIMEIMSKMPKEKADLLADQLLFDLGYDLEENAELPDNTYSDSRGRLNADAKDRPAGGGGDKTGG